MCSISYSIFCEEPVEVFNSINVLSLSSLLHRQPELLLNELLIKSESNCCFWLLKLALHKQLYLVHFPFSLIHIINVWTFHEAALVFILAAALYELQRLNDVPWSSAFIQLIHTFAGCISHSSWELIIYSFIFHHCLFSGGEAFNLMLFHSKWPLESHFQLLSCA